MHKPLMRTHLMLMCVVVCGAAAADPTPKSDNKAAGQPSATAGASAAQSAPGAKARPAAPAIPDQYKLNLLIRTTIIAVNQANKTGNYSVLRDLGSPMFQIKNSVANLTEAFAAQRKADLDLSPVLFFTPKLTRVPAIDDDGMLRVAGYFPTEPQAVQFDLAFEFVGGEWRHFGVAVGTLPAAAVKTPKSPKTTPAAK